MAPHPHRPGEPWLGGKTGGVSGPAVRAVALAQVSEVRGRVRIPIVGMGGVQSGRHADDLLRAGADLVAVGSESFRDPLAGCAHSERALSPSAWTLDGASVTRPKVLQTARLSVKSLHSIEPQLQVKVNYLPRVLSEAASAVDSPPMPPATKTPSKPTTAAPERSLVQRMEALQRANEIRTRRATLKRDLKAGKVSIHDLLLEPPEYVHSAKVFDLLLAVPKYGRVKVNKVLQLCRISPSKTIGGLSPRQRTELVSMLRR